jgi:hypothetical protein
MALSDSIKKHAAKKADACTVALLIETMPEADRKVFTEHLKNGFPTNPLVMALREEGYKMSDNTLNAHRQGKCKCGNV